MDERYVPDPISVPDLHDMIGAKLAVLGAKAGRFNTHCESERLMVSIQRPS
jgi:hypothetical protein